MIIDRITLENFGVYVGHQTVELTPPSDDKPVVLFGALNGGGKTTFLDAIQLVLYGKFADCSNRGNLSYADFLKKCISESATDRKARLELVFRHTTSGRHDAYTIERVWEDRGGKIAEDFVVSVNGEFDEYLSDNWAEAVERILPRQIANLFLFDGEKIESYASPEAARELVKSAVHGLLGIDFVHQLERDLAVLAQKKIKAGGNDQLAKEIKQLECDFQEFESKRRSKVSEISRIRTDLDKIEKRAKQVELEFQQKGGLIYERRAEIEKEIEETESEISKIGAQLRDLASGSAPLLLVQSLVLDVLSQGNLEVEAEQNKALLTVLEARDSKVLALAETHDCSNDLAKQLAEFLSSDRRCREQTLDLEPYLKLSLGAITDIRFLVEREFESLRGEARELLAEHKRLIEQRDKRQSELASAPAEEVIQQLLIEREELGHRSKELDQEMLALRSEIETLRVNMTRTQQQLANKVERKIRSDIENEDSLQVIEHATRASRTLSQFRKAAVKRHLSRIETLILESFKQLHRKRQSVGKIQIDPEDFSVSLHRESGEEISPERMSAGERQLLAVATLWGLARASNRKLPTIIDTPLGRLDSKHRGNLVDLYFPRASHQVVLLSTDEEIVDGYLERLMPSVGYSYELVFDDESGATKIREGYFEAEKRHVH